MAVHLINPIVTVPIHGGQRNMAAGLAIPELTWVKTVEMPQRKKKTVKIKQSSAVGVRVQLIIDSIEAFNFLIPFLLNTVGTMHSDRRRSPRPWPLTLTLTPDLVIRTVEGETGFFHTNIPFQVIYGPLSTCLYHLNRASGLHLVIKDLCGTARPWKLNICVSLLWSSILLQLDACWNDMRMFAIGWMLPKYSEQQSSVCISQFLESADSWHIPTNSIHLPLLNHMGSSSIVVIRLVRCIPYWSSIYLISTHLKKNQEKFYFVAFCISLILMLFPTAYLMDMRMT